jgi:hypothetical protein
VPRPLCKMCQEHSAVDNRGFCFWCLETVRREAELKKLNRKSIIVFII